MKKKLETKPVFYDPHKRRWWWISWFLKSLGAWACVVGAVFLYNLIKNPQLPSLALQSVQTFSQTHHLIAVQPKNTSQRKEVTYQQTKEQLLTYLKTNQRKKWGTSASSTQTNSQIIGFYVNWDDTSFTSLKRNIGELDILMPEWLHLSDQPDQLTIDDLDREKQVLDLVQQRKPTLQILPLVNNFNRETQDWDQKRLSKMLRDPQSRFQNIFFLKQYVLARNAGGITIDYENVAPQDQPFLQIYMQELAANFHAAHLQVTEAVPADDDDFNYKELSQTVDYLIFMMYDEHWDASEAGPVASQGWFNAQLQKDLADLPPNKYVIALGTYGYDWIDKGSRAEVLSFQQVMQRVQSASLEPALDSTLLNPSFQYKDANGTQHTVWYLDGVTFFNQLQTSRLYKPRGWAIWRLGTEDPSIWNVTAGRTKIDSNLAQQLQQMHYGYDVHYQGKGEILQVTATPQDGTRQVGYDNALGLIMTSTLTSPPLPYIITRWGGQQEKKVVLTFDDGPDPYYSPRILDVLKEKQVPATFFVIGSQADLYPQILQRMFDENHEVGNHTFTHPNLSSIPSQQWALEINSTERLFESRLGRDTLLFRPPYAEDVEPETSDQVRPLVYTSKLGYYTVGMNIDPKDYKRPGVDQIVQTTIDEVENGEGNIVLLHDGGGDRSQTVAALPQIIDKLREDGYTFVNIADLIGLKRSDVMPLATSDQKLQAQTFTIGFNVFRWVGILIPVLFLLGIVLGTTRLLFLGALAVVNTRRNSLKKFDDCYQPTVTVLIPAFNEEKVIVATVHSVLRSTYAKYKVIVVDDGSSDRTYQRLQHTFSQHPLVQLYKIHNEGKAAALNFALSKAKSEIIVAMDADTRLHKDAIAKLVRHFVNPRIGAVAGNAKVGNRQNFLTKWQALEYITSQNLDRQAFAFLNCITVVPGAIGAWHTTLVKQSGGFVGDTLAEDTDLTLRILERGYLVEYEDEAIAYTEAPVTIGSFLKQRFRWTFGTLQVVWKHRFSFLTSKNKKLGYIALPNVLIFQVFFPFISPLMDFLVVSSLVTGFLTQLQHPEDWAYGGFQRILFFYLLFVGIDFGAALLAFLLEKKEDYRLLLWLFWQRLLYRQLMYYVVVKSVMNAVQGNYVGWNKLERQG